MKTSVTKIMMSFALMGCMIFSASDASAQGRSRSQGGSTTSRSQTAAVSRSSNTTAPAVSHSATSQVTRPSSSSSSTTRPQATRPSSSSSSTVSPKVTTTPQVTRPSSSSSSTRPAASSSTSSQITRPTTPSSSTSSGSRPGTGAVTRPGNSGSTSSGTTGGTTGVIRQSDNPKVSIDSKNKTTDLTSGVNGTTKTTVGKPGGNGGKPGDGNGGKPGDRPNGGKPGDRPSGGNGGNGHGGNGHGGNGHGGNGHGGNGHGGNGHGHGGHQGFGNNNHFDYTGHHYHNDFHNYYTHHLWSWSRPLPPPARPYRPAPLVWYRPVIPAGWYPYAGAPVIDRILGITFGTLFDVSLDYLYYNGYEIDGYADHIIYLRNVSLLNHLWDDVMLSFDSYDRLVNAQFVYHTAYYDRHRFDRVYRNLCRVYGQPIGSDTEGISWYGGNKTGWVTLSMHNNLGHYYTTISIGY